MDVNGTITGSAITCYNADDNGVAQISAYGSNQGTGRLYVGQSGAYGGGIEYNGDDNPASTGAGADYITLYRVDNNSYNWTARNYYNTNNWEFRGTVEATGFISSGLSRLFGETQFKGGTHTSHANYSTNRDWYIRSGEAAGKVIIQDTGGYVGIGESTPASKLDVNGNIRCNGFRCDDNIGYFYEGLRVSGSEATINYNSTNRAYGPDGIDSDPNNMSFGLSVLYAVRAAVYVAHSDERIKSNIVDIHDTTALDQLRQLQPKHYEYVDKAGRGSSTVIGFIAQEVKEVVPEAVSVADGDIPNIYETANVSANTLTFTNFHTSNLDATSNTLVVYEEGHKRKDLTIVEVVDEHTIRVDTEVAGEAVFVYGQVVQDFHHLNKDYLGIISI